MRLLLKNVIKAIAITCLLLTILITLYNGIYYYNLEKVVNSNDDNVEKLLVETGKHIYGDSNIVSNDEGYKQVGKLAILVPNYARFEINAIIIFFSIMVGSMIGAAISTIDRPKKTKIITFLPIFLFVIIARVAFEISLTGTINMNNLIKSFSSLLFINVIIFVVTFLIIKLYIKKLEKKKDKKQQ